MTREMALRLDTEKLRQQVWRAEKLYAEFIRYARSIGCDVVRDEIVTDDPQARMLADWWMENAA